MSTVATRRPGGAALLRRAAPLAGIALVLVLAAVTTPEFYEASSLRLVGFQIGLIGVTAIGQALVLLVGGIDLSVGAVIGATTVIIASQTDGAASGLPFAILVALAAALAVGAANAALVLVRAVPPFVATFATFVLVQGAITAATGGAPSGEVPDALSVLGADRVLGVPVPLVVFVVLAAVAAVVLGRTTVGRALYATGANRRAAELSGLRSTAIIAGAYVACALLACVAGLIYAGYVGRVDAELSRSLNLDSIAAAVIGGIALTGGRGTIGQAVAGVVLLAALIVWMTQLGAGIGGRLTVEGAVILLAVYLQQRTTNRPER